MKKKVLAGILAATMAFSMAACGSTGSSSDSGSSAASGSTAKTEEKGEPYTVTMVLQGTTQPDEERIEEKINRSPAFGTVSDSRGTLSAVSFHSGYPSQMRSAHRRISVRNR